MSTRNARFDFREPVSYDPDRKLLFHRSARRQLRLLGQALGFPTGSYDLRNNHAGIAVSGEITLHAEELYVQVSQSCMGCDTGILFRTCSGRKDYVGGRNNFASLDLLHDPKLLAQRIREACHV